MKSKIGQALIYSMFGYSDLQTADKTLEGLGDPDDFVEWLGTVENEELAVNLLNGDADIVALVYEYLISQLDDSDAVIQYIKETAMDKLSANYMCTSFDHDLEDDTEFTTLLKDGLETKVRSKDNAKLMTAYLNENPDCINDILLWVLDGMNLTVEVK